MKRIREWQQMWFGVCLGAGVGCVSTYFISQHVDLLTAFMMSVAIIAWPQTFIMVLAKRAAVQQDERLTWAEERLANVQAMCGLIDVFGWFAALALSTLFGWPYLWAYILWRTMISRLYFRPQVCRLSDLILYHQARSVVSDFDPQCRMCGETEEDVLMIGH